MAASLKRKRDKAAEDAAPKRRQITPEAIEDTDMLEDTSSVGENEPGHLDPDETEWTSFGKEKETIVQEHQDHATPVVIPSGHEVRVMKEATELYQSSSFKLKIDALLPSVRPKYSSSAAGNLEFVLRQLHELLLAIPSISPLHPLQASADLIREGFAVPYCQPLPTEETNWKVAFEPPSDIKLVGSWANKVSVKAKDGEKYCVDLAVEMPDSLFQEKDYLNGRFFQKRAFYVATIAAALHKKFPDHVEYQSTFGETRLTTIVLQSLKDKSKNDFSKLNAQIRIIPVLQKSSPIPQKHLSPSRCNIRVTTSSNELPTPRYNSSLLLCMTPLPNLLSTYALKTEIKGYEDALALLKVWANQRGYGEGTSGWCIDGFEGRSPFWSGVISLLINGEESTKTGKKKLRPVGKGLSSYQLFKAALGFLARHDFETSPVYIKNENGHEYVQEYETNHEAVLVDSSALVNLVHGIPMTSLHMLRQDAKITLEALDSDSDSGDPFSEAFLEDKRHLPTRFDIVIQVDLTSAKLKNPTNLELLDIGSSGNLLLLKLAQNLRRGLNNRAKAIAILHNTSSPRPLTQAHPYTPSVIQIGLILDPDHAFRLVDHGPSAEEAADDHSFRDFWGAQKAELRRFKDGKIAESVVWDIKTHDEKARIPGMIVTHLLGLHFGIQSTVIRTWQSSFDEVVRLPKEVSEVYDHLDPKVGFKAAMVAYDTLVKQIKELADLPLSILNVSPVCDSLRYTASFVPVAITTKKMATFPPWMRYLPTMDIVLEFEKSPKWPDELGAIQKMKLAFFEQIARSIMDAVKGAKANVVVGGPSASSEIEDQARLEIVTPDGWAFSARIWHDREATLLDRIIDAKPHVSPNLQHQTGEGSSREKHQAVRAKDLYLRRFIAAPKHHRAILNVSQRYAAFSGTVRLVKRWFASHWLLKGHVSEEAVELICAKSFIGDGKTLRGDLGDGQDNRPGVPITKERGFALVIQFLTSWKWEDVLVVPVYGSGKTIEQPGKMVSSAGVWRLVTEEDPAGRVWTRDGPDAVIARRVTTFAKATWDTLLQGTNTGSWHAKSIYTHPTSDYNFVIQLDAAVLVRSHHNIRSIPSDLQKKAKYANLSGGESAEGTINPGFDPAQLFLDDLKRAYADTIVFFGDSFGGDRIGAIWLPTLNDPRPFKVLSGFSSSPILKNNEKGKEKPLVALNKDAILAEIKRMGNGMIKNISVQDQ